MTMQTMNGVRVYRAEPVAASRGTVIVIHEIWGLVPQITGVADRWAAEGYLAIAPDLTSEVGITPELGLELQRASAEPDEAKRTAMQPRLREGLAPLRAPEFAATAVAKLRALVDALVDEDERIGVTGFCFGGTYSFALAAADDRVRVAVPFYGTAPSPEKIASIHCPVLALYGEIDPAIMEALPAVVAEMERAGVDFEHHVYPGARHAFFNETNPSTYDPEVARDAWARATAFIAEKIG